MHHEDPQNLNRTSDESRNASLGKTARQICFIQDDPHSIITTYPDLFLALAQLRFQRIMEELDSIREKDTSGCMTDNIKAIEENLAVMYSLYRRSLEYMSARRINT